MTIETISEHPCFGGKVGFYRHASIANNCNMQFSVFVPPQAENRSVPVVTFLSGLTCTEETFMIKSGAQRIAAILGLMLVSPDTSPRGDGVPDDPEGAYDFGLAAGFYLNATQKPWSQHYHMYDYVTRELQDAVFDAFPGDRNRQSITGHSMGGHGALTVGLRNPESTNPFPHSHQSAARSIVPGGRRRLAITWAMIGRHGANTIRPKW